jgi:DNA repair exonuclease SbcCD ATPase subunit
MQWHEATSKLMNELIAVKRDLQQKTMELQEALDQVKQLKGLLPICASCKKIRDDKGYWQSVEHYISAHTEAQFSHDICPECMKKLYPEYCEKPRVDK